MIVQARYQATLPQMGFAKFEPSTRGPWPAKEYGRLVGCIGQVINSLALLSGAYGTMDRTWARRLAENADTLHPSFVSPTPSHHLLYIKCATLLIGEM